MKSAAGHVVHDNFGKPSTADRYAQFQNYGKQVLSFVVLRLKSSSFKQELRALILYNAPEEVGNVMFQNPIDAVIIGAGAAGLFAADRLNRAGLSFLVLEADGRAGGRVQSRREIGSDLGLVLDEGANLINSTDTLAIGLLDRFAVPYVRRLPRGVDHMHYVLNGKSYDQAGMQQLLFRAGEPALSQMVRDQIVWEQDANRDIDPYFIAESIADYLKRIGADRPLVTLLHSFFWSEYGRLLEELNLHVLFDYLKIDLTNKSFRLIPNADEAYTVPGGTGQIMAGLEAASHFHIKYGRRVFQITDKFKDHVVVECHNSQGELETYLAKVVLFAAPLHSLRDILVSVSGVRRESLSQARDVTYARGTKLHMKFKTGFHKVYRYPGILLTDSGEQIWPSDTGQNGGGLMTVLTGPMSQTDEALAQRVRQILETLDTAAPGSSGFFVGVERSDAPMSYSGSLRPGEVAELAINKGSERWITMGEASGGELQGYLEGAFRSAEEGTARLIIQLQKTKTLQMMSAKSSLSV